MLLRSPVTHVHIILHSLSLDNYIQNILHVTLLQYHNTFYCNLKIMFDFCKTNFYHTLSKLHIFDQVKIIKIQQCSRFCHISVPLYSQSTCLLMTSSLCMNKNRYEIDIIDTTSQENSIQWSSTIDFTYVFIMKSSHQIDPSLKQ